MICAATWESALPSCDGRASPGISASKRNIGSRMSRGRQQKRVPEVGPSRAAIHPHPGAETLGKESNPRIREHPSIEGVVQTGQECVHVRSTEAHAQQQVHEQGNPSLSVWGTKKGFAVKRRIWPRCTTNSCSIVEA